jgi:hypothetical protein
MITNNGRIYNADVQSTTVAEHSLAQEKIVQTPREKMSKNNTSIYNPNVQSTIVAEHSLAQEKIVQPSNSNSSNTKRKV